MNNEDYQDFLNLKENLTKFDDMAEYLKELSEFKDFQVPIMTD